MFPFEASVRIPAPPGSCDPRPASGSVLVEISVENRRRKWAHYMLQKSVTLPELRLCRTPRQTGPDLRCGGSVSDREYPLFTGVNGTLMARHGAPDLR
jgi:hypothetical protein